MAHFSHKGTAGHTIGSAIIGKDDGKPADSMEPQSGQQAVGFSHIPDIHIKGATNGVSVTHTPKGESGHEAIGRPETPTEEQLHVFRDATEAHNHIGQLLGVRMASGQQQT